MFESWGRPQPGYNPYIHGPYNPGTFYGKADTPLKDVKLAELPAWFGRRSKNPVDWSRAVFRGVWRWNQRWFDAKKPGIAPLVHLIAGSSMAYYFLQYRSHTDERRAKYH